MAEAPILGGVGGATGVAAILAPLGLALLLAWRERKPADAAEFDGRAGELSPGVVGLSLATSDLALAGALLLLPFEALLPYGGLVCMQGILVGGVLGRWIVSRWFLPACFSARERSPLAWIEERLGPAAAGLVEWVFTLGTLLATVGRLFLFVFALHLSIGASIPGAHALGGWLGFGLIACGVLAAAALLALVRGLRGSVAGDGWLFGVVLAAACAGLVGLVGRLYGGWSVFVEVLFGSQKHLPLSFAASPALAHTFWTALCVSSLASAAHYGADPVQLSRLLATGKLASARKALWISLVGAVPALALCLVGVALLAWRERNDLSPVAAAIVGARDERRWPVFVAEQLAPLARGLVLSAFAISAVVASRSALSALLQVLGRRRRRRGAADPTPGGMRLRVLLLAAAILLTGLALQPWTGTHASALDWLLRACAWSGGILFAAAGLAFLRPVPRAEGLFWATPLALAGMLALCARGPAAERACDLFAATYFLAWTGWRFLPDWFGYRRHAGALVELAGVGAALLLLCWSVRWGETPLERNFRFDTEWVWLPLSSPWYVPTGGWIGFVFGCLLARGSAGNEGFARSDAR